MPKILPTPKDQRQDPAWELLNSILDPDVHMGIVDLGLIYNIKIDKKGLATVTMTLTSPMCPMGGYLTKEVEDKMRMVKGVNDVVINLVWDPPWTRDLIDEDMQLLMGLL